MAFRVSRIIYCDNNNILHDMAVSSLIGFFNDKSKDSRSAGSGLKILL